MTTPTEGARLEHGWAVAPGLRASLRVPQGRWLLAALLTALAVAVLARSAPWSEIRAAIALAAAEPVAIVLAAAAYTVAFWLRAVAWRLLLTTPVPVGRLFVNLQLSLVLNHLLPVKAGEVSRPLLAVRRGVPAQEAVTTTVLARLLDLACLAAIALAAAPLARDWGALGFAAQVASAGIAASVAVLALWRRRVPPLVSRVLGRRGEDVHEALRAIPLERIALALPVVALSWVLEAAVLLAAAHLLAVEVPVEAAVGATAFTILFQVLHLTPGGIGIYEAAMTAALVSHGVDPSSAVALAVVTHAMKFAYAFSAGALLGSSEALLLMRGARRSGPRRASRFEIAMARLWNVVNEGKPFTPLFAAAIVLLLSLPHALSVAYWGRASMALVAVLPLAGLFWRFDFPMKLRAALWLYLALWLAVAGSVPAGTVLLTLGLYLGFTVVLWGTVYYHLRIGTRWTNGFRFARLVAENEDPTSGNLLEQLPKVLLLVLAFQSVASTPETGSIATVVAFTALIGISALLLHQWFFTWVPALPQPRIAFAELASHSRRGEAEMSTRRARRVIAIVIDGCRADRLTEARTPFIDGLRAQGADFRRMNTVYPARTVTCFSSMLTGAPPEVHGMRSNFVPSLGVKCESIFDLLRQQGRAGRLVGIAHLIDAFGESDVRSVTSVMHNDEIDDALVAQAQGVLIGDDPDLLVLQLLSVDQTGHARGSYNDEYVRKIEETDAKIDEFLGWCRERGYLDGATVLITADHGQGIGIGGHGHLSPSEVRIPCILWGAGVEAGRVDDETRFITDIAPTISELLGLPAPRDSVGRSLLDSEAAEETRPVVFVVPAYNEERNLPGVLTAIAAADVGPSHVVVVDDGSTDETGAVARSHGALVVAHLQNRGLGAAVRTGLAAARELDPRGVIYLDADGEYDPREASRLLAPIEAGEADYVLGSRFGRRPEGMTRSRHLVNRAFSVLLSICCGRWIRDGQTGYRAFSPRALEVAEIVHDYNYAQVLTLDLLRKGMRMREVEIAYRRRESGRSFVTPRYLWRVPLGMLREMVRR